MKRETADILVDLISGCSRPRGSSNPRTAELLAELGQKDPRQGRLWQKILAYWDHANHELKVNVEELPAGLPTGGSLCFVVLGYELNADGSMQEELRRRLETVLRCARRYPKAYVLCTGGGTARDNPQATEAGQMGNWLQEQGVAAERLIIEDRSLTTAENAEFSAAILRADHPDVDSVVIVSSPFHVPWGALLFETAFLMAAAEEAAEEARAEASVAALGKAGKAGPAYRPHLHVVDSASYPPAPDPSREAELLLWQAGGMMELIGEKERAREFYRQADQAGRVDISEQG